ncbi:hypothetical protein MPER_07436 [Moniliophthora perniciosa FA553]|nr:hypothetical protein MPER_07436 [Moniliophthora perniciosa FA553]
MPVRILELVASQSMRTGASYAILKKLHDKATRIFSQSQATDRSVSSPSSDDFVNSEDELEIFAGHTKVRMSKFISSMGRRRKRGMGPGQGNRTDSLGGGSGSEGYSSGGTIGTTELGHPLTSSPSPQDEVSAAYGENPFTQSMFATMVPGSGGITFTDYNVQGSDFEGMDWIIPETSSMSMAGESGMDAQWLSFMQNEGILDDNGNLNTNSLT